MSRLRAIALEVWEFVVGDDPLVAVGVAATIAVVAVLESLGVGAWWAMVAGVALVLIASLRRAG